MTLTRMLQASQFAMVATLLVGYVQRAQCISDHLQPMLGEAEPATLQEEFSTRRQRILQRIANLAKFGEADEEQYWRRRLRWEQEARWQAMKRQHKEHKATSKTTITTSEHKQNRGAPVHIDSHGGRFEFIDGTLHDIGSRLSAHRHLLLPPQQLHSVLHPVAQRVITIRTTSNTQQGRSKRSSPSAQSH